jgi:hypothetical protein
MEIPGTSVSATSVRWHPTTPKAMAVRPRSGNSRCKPNDQRSKPVKFSVRLDII